MPSQVPFNPGNSIPKTVANRSGSDAWSFFRAWLAAPLRVAAVAPSSSALAELITQEITPATGPVLELGAGTGAFTRALIARGVAERDLTLVEFGSDFARLLEMRFPAARVRWMDAACLREAGLFDAPVVGAVISGMPVLSMPPRKVIAILRGAFGYMRPGGAFYQFTYTTRCPIPDAILMRLGLRATRIGSTLRNLPPAAVYRISRRPPSPLRLA
ncbi:class I SAM-dependent methyltransferase [Bosea sp. NPDC055332]